jgi:parvulin-like peptidyl-prolyl isomerase
MANPRESKPVLHTKKHIARLERERQQTRLILGGFVAVLLVALGMIIYGYVDLKYLQARRPVARIANASIPIGEWQARVRMQRTRLINQLQLYQQYSQYFGMDLSSQEQQILSQLNSTNTMGQTVLDEMIDEELIRQEAAKRGIVASTQEVDQSIQASFQFYPSGTPTPTVTPTPVTLPTLSADTLALVTITPTPTLFMTATASPTSTPNPGASAAPTVALSPTPTATAGPSPTVTPTSTPIPTETPYTLQGFETAYDSSVKELVAQGLTEAQVHQLYENNVLRQKLFDQITADVPRTQEQVWARHILVADEATAKTVRDRLVSGEDFAKVAAEVSTDTGTKAKGGDLGWFGKGAMVPEFEAAAFSLKVGEISQPVKSQFGYHIIQVLAHEEIPLDSAGYNQAKQTVFTDWLARARTDYKVVTYDNWQNVVPTDPAAPAIAQ